MKKLNKTKIGINLTLATAIVINKTTQINADAGDTLITIIKNAGGKAVSMGNAVGIAIASLVTGICGIVALGIGFSGMWKAKRGAEGVFDEEAPKVFMLIIVAIIAGLVAAAFFNNATPPAA